MAAQMLPFRLKLAMEEGRVDQTQLAKAVGVTPSAINQILSGQTRQSRFLSDIAEQLGVSVRWLRGEEDINGPSGLPMALPPERAVTPQAMAEQLDLVGVEEISLEFGLGSTVLSDDHDRVLRYVPRAWLEHFSTSPAELLTFARGRGDSMMPTILDNDLVLIDRGVTRMTRQDDVWAVGFGELGGIKRLRSIGQGNIRIMSDNANVPDEVVPAEELRIIGRVCGNLRKM